MLNRCLLLVRCPTVTYPSRPPCLPLTSPQHQLRRSVADLVSRKKVPVRPYRRRQRGTFTRAPIGPAETLDAPEHEQKQSSFASHLHDRKRRRSSTSPVRPVAVLSREQSRKTCAQSPLQVRAGEQLVNSVGRWQPSPRGRSQRRAVDLFRRLERIEKPSRPIGPHKTPRRWLEVSLGLWPKDSSWSSQQSPAHSLEAMNFDWYSNFQTLNIPEEMQEWTGGATKQVIRQYWGLPSGRNHVFKGRMGLSGYDSGTTWRNVMLWCLKYKKKQALMLLLATLKGHKYRPPRYMVQDCLKALARHFLLKVSKPSATAVDAIWLLTCRFIEGASGQNQRFPISQLLVYLVLQHSDDSRMLSLYGRLGSNKVVLHVNTMLQFLYRFLAMGEVDRSMKVLDIIVKTDFDTSRDRIQVACVKLLRARFDTQEEYIVRSNMLTQILEMGIRPNVYLFNTILLNAGEGGDFANAWQMYNLAKEHSIILGPITYSVLLKGAIISGDSSNLNMVLCEIQTNKNVLKDLRLVSDVLRAVSLISPGDEFGAMLDFYKQHCDLRPIQELSMCGDETKTPPSTTCHRDWPTSFILTQMILAYVKLHQDSLGLIHNYNLYYQHVKENHPLIAPLAQNDFVANSFILAFGKNSSTLQHCTTVIRHMLELSSPNFLEFGSIPYAAPTTQTWSILVASYFRHRQRRPAEKVLDMMRERGIHRDIVTWNTMIGGYARMQDVSAAVDAVEGMKAAGFEADSFTVGGLRYLRTKDRLRWALRESTRERSVVKRIVGGLVPPKEQYEAELVLSGNRPTEPEMRG